VPEITFTTTPRAETEGNLLLIEVPGRVVRALGDKQRPPVRATINGYTYPTTIAVYGGKHYLPARREVREAAKLEPRKLVTVHLALDTGERTVDMPPDLARALAGDKKAKASFDGLSFSHRREYAQWIAGAKREETRAARVSKAVAALRAGKKGHGAEVRSG